MKVVVLRDKEQLVIEERPVPKAEGHDVLVRVACTGICGTDLGAFRALSLPAGTVMGHEFAGWVEAVGSEVTNCRVGDRVVIRPCSVCFKCPWCMEDRISLCPDHLDDTIGLKNVDGAYAEFTLVHDFQVFLMSPKVTMEQAAQLEPLAVAVHAVDESNITKNSRVLIIGAGSVGLLILQCVLATQVKEVVVLEKSPFRRNKAKSLGANVVTSETDVADDIRKAYPRKGYDVVIETAGKPDTVKTSLSLVAKGGRVTFVGMATEPVDIDQFHLVASGIHIACSIGYYAKHWDIAMNLLENGQVDLDSMITGEYPLERIEDGFRALMNPEKDLKVLIRINQEGGAL